MLTAIDFSKYAHNGKYYGGSERKEGNSINGEDYMLKFQKKTAFGMRNNHISEFLGSHIFEMRYGINMSNNKHYNTCDKWD